MGVEHKSFISRTVVTVIGIGLCYLITKNRKRILQEIRLACNFRNVLKHQQISVVTNNAECQEALNILNKHCAEYNVLGFDCEWVTVHGRRRPVALLQLATHRGYCALVRLCNLGEIPVPLGELLRNENILKVGVAPSGDAAYLANDFGVIVNNTFDLRHLAVLAKEKPESLSKMSLSVLNVELDKDWRIRCSDWETQTFTERQLKYAANDAHVAIELFKQFENKIQRCYFWQNRRKALDEFLKICEPCVDLPFDMKFYSNPAIANKILERKNTTRSVTKQFTRKNSTRAKKLYDNCLLLAPDEEVLCTCDRKKAEWYVSNGLGIVKCEEPYSVRLNFEPAGRAVGEVGKYYTLPKENKCVVCGRADAYNRKNVVPREYRKHFPDVMKSHNSHDILLLCPTCHQLSNIFDLKLREKLAKICQAPLSSEKGGAKLKEIPKLKQFRSVARALLKFAEEIPENRRKELEKKFLENYPPGTQITLDLLQEAVDIDILEVNPEYCAHGFKVADYFKAKNGGLTELERMWREHFLGTMKPAHLPELWSVTHNVPRLEIRANEGRIETGDLEIAGLITPTNAKTAQT